MGDMASNLCLTACPINSFWVLDTPIAPGFKLTLNFRFGFWLKLREGENAMDATAAPLYCRNDLLFIRFIVIKDSVKNGNKLIQVKMGRISSPSTSVSRKGLP